MPELPEVTTVINILNSELKGRIIKNIEVLHRNIIQNELCEFNDALLNNTINFITRLGKFIIFHLNNNVVMISHLRMEGKYSLLNINDVNPPHSCVIFYLDNNTKLVYHDTRKFGILKTTTEHTYLSEKPLSLLGPEPFVIDENNIDDIIELFNKNKTIKELLLDQTIMAGIGNIYADEILFAAKINPFTKGKDLSKSEIIYIINLSKKILNKAIELGGSTIKSYHPKEGVDGRFQIELKAYGRHNKECINCGTPMEKTYLGGRGTTYCPNCQPNASLEKAIGITGMIGSGKSAVLQAFSNLGYKTYSTDAMVAYLYKEEFFIKKIIKLFGKQILKNGIIDKEKIRILIKNNNVLHTKLENLIFPIIKEKLIEIILESKTTPVIEVPLLFKAHMEYLFKTIIVVEADEKTIIKRIKESRNYDAVEAIELYKKDNKFDLTNKKILRFCNNFENLNTLELYIKKELINKF